jgi:hypothetical protein
MFSKYTVVTVACIANLEDINQDHWVTEFVSVVALNMASSFTCYLFHGEPVFNIWLVVGATQFDS